jgi:hypothetical protein
MHGVWAARHGMRGQDVARPRRHARTSCISSSAHCSLNCTSPNCPLVSNAVTMPRVQYVWATASTTYDGREGHRGERGGVERGGQWGSYEQEQWSVQPAVCPTSAGRDSFNA